MDGFNKVILMGTVGTDPEFKIIGENSRVATFSLATNRSWKEQNGQRKEVPEWHRIEVWNQTADFVNTYIQKGKHLLIEGEIRYESFDGKNGEKVYLTKIAASKIQFVLGPSGNGQPGNNGQPQQQQTQQAQQQVSQYIQQGGGQPQQQQQQFVPQQQQQFVPQQQQQQQFVPQQQQQVPPQQQGFGAGNQQVQRNYGSAPDDLPF